MAQLIAFELGYQWSNGEHLVKMKTITKKSYLGMIMDTKSKKLTYLKAKESERPVDFTGILQDLILESGKGCRSATIKLALLKIINHYQK